VRTAATAVPGAGTTPAATPAALTPAATPPPAATPVAAATPPPTTPAPTAAAAPAATVLGVGAGLQRPRGIGVDSSGHIYIADSGNDRIVRLAAGGTVAGSWSIVGPTNTPGPSDSTGDLATTPDGQSVTIDVHTGTVQAYAADGKALFTVPHVASSPSGIALGPDGRIWVADTAGGRVVRLTADGKPDATFTGGPAAPTRFEQPVDVVVAPDGTAYVIDLRRRIVRLDAQGQNVQSWPIQMGFARGASHLAFWHNQVVWTDPDRNQLGLLDPATGAVRYVGKTGTAPGQFRVPTGIASGPDGKLYVVDSDNARVQVFTTLDTK
jgi:streptogramin lyase